MAYEDNIYNMQQDQDDWMRRMQQVQPPPQPQPPQQGMQLRPYGGSLQAYQPYAYPQQQGMQGVPTQPQQMPVQQMQQPSQPQGMQLSPEQIQRAQAAAQRGYGTKEDIAYMQGLDEQTRQAMRQQYQQFGGRLGQDQARYQGEQLAMMPGDQRQAYLAQLPAHLQQQAMQQFQQMGGRPLPQQQQGYQAPRGQYQNYAEGRTNQNYNMQNAARMQQAQQQQAMLRNRPAQSPSLGVPQGGGSFDPAALQARQQQAMAAYRNQQIARNPQLAPQPEYKAVLGRVFGPQPAQPQTASLQNKPRNSIQPVNKPGQQRTMPRSPAPNPSMPSTGPAGNYTKPGPAVPGNTRRTIQPVRKKPAPGQMRIMPVISQRPQGTTRPAGLLSKKR